MTASDTTTPRQFYHGTRADLKRGDLIAAGYSSNFGARKQASWAYLTGTLDAAIWGAELATGDGRERIYIVEPTGPIVDDPNLTDKKFPGQPGHIDTSGEERESALPRFPLQAPLAIGSWRRAASLAATETWWTVRQASQSLHVRNWHSKESLCRYIPLLGGHPAVTGTSRRHAKLTRAGPQLRAIAAMRHVRSDRMNIRARATVGGAGRPTSRRECDDAVLAIWQYPARRARR